MSISNSKKEISDKSKHVAIVTGAGGEIGRAISLRLASDGNAVIANDSVLSLRAFMLKFTRFKI